MKIQIKSISGDVLFEYEKENNSIKDTLLQGIKSGANLRSANLSYADLRSVDLSYANLRSANLRSANLRSANLSYADLRSANLRSANLRSADLRSVDLRSADLSYADLSYADLSYADLRSAKNAESSIAKTRILPEGDLIVYKKVREGIVKLLIPKEAKRSSAFGRKCRAEYAVVLELPDGITEAHSSHDSSFKYTVGATIKPTNGYDENWMEECAGGIHFFITRIEAEEY